MSIAENIKSILEEIPREVKLVAVSKTKPNDIISEAYDTGHRLFGENKAQELVRKQEELPSYIEWHFIGHLQTNKVKTIAPFVNMIHSVDSLKLLQEINKQAIQNNRIIRCLLEFHIGTEESKFGLDIQRAKEIFNSKEYRNMENIHVYGVMGMATLTDDEDQIRSEFKKLRSYHRELKKEFFKDKAYFNEISMGMTNDYHIAIEEGSTLIRVGSGIFGERN